MGFQSGRPYCEQNISNDGSNSDDPALTHRRILPLGKWHRWTLEKTYDSGPPDYSWWTVVDHLRVDYSNGCTYADIERSSWMETGPKSKWNDTFSVASRDRRIQAVRLKAIVVRASADNSTVQSRPSQLWAINQNWEGTGCTKYDAQRYRITRRRASLPSHNRSQ